MTIVTRFTYMGLKVYKLKKQSEIPNKSISDGKVTRGRPPKKKVTKVTRIAYITGFKV